MLNFSIFFSILNKLTPEKFDKLSLELLNVGINSELVLRGVILLVNISSPFFVRSTSQHLFLL